MLADQCLVKFLEKPFNTVLDIGCGKGEASSVFRDQGKIVTSLDITDNPHANIIADYMQFKEKPFDAIWCSHVLEHQFDPNKFLKKIYDDLKDKGWLAITVPPRKDEIVGGHVSLWNAGLLVYHLVLAGFDCSDCHIKTYGYNCSVVVQKKKASNTANLQFCNGDIEKLKPWLPSFFHHGVNGNINEWNWNVS